jgi:TatD DNase family protein
MAAFDEDRDQVIARAKSSGIDVVLNPGIDLESSEAAAELARRYPGVVAAVGFHPHEAAKVDEGGLEALRNLCGHQEVVAIGEIGLDFYRNLSPRDTQLSAFERQLELAARMDMPAIIHSREAHWEVLDVLRGWVWQKSSGQPRGVIHCFSGDAALAEQYLNLGFFLSLAGPVAYSSSPRISEMVQSLPLDSLLVETDSPFLAPQPHRGQRNEPSYLVSIIEQIARVRGVPPGVVGQKTAENASRLFNLSR